MSWHYQIRKRIIGEDEFYDIVEMYHDDNGNHTGWTIDSMSPNGNTKEELIKDIEMMLADANKHPVFEDKDV